MIVLQVKRSGEVGILTPGGELSAERADELRAFLNKALDSANHVVLSLKYVTDMDISCFHLLCSVYRAALLRNKSFTVSGGNAGIFKRAMESAESARCTNCIWDRERCLWRAHFERQISLVR